MRRLTSRLMPSTGSASPCDLAARFERSYPNTENRHEKFMLVLDSLVELIFPQVCASCSTRYGEEGSAGLCSSCEKRLEYFSGRICSRCSRPSKSDPCRLCRTALEAYGRLLILGWYRGILGAAVRGAKIGGEMRIIERFADELCRRLKAEYDAVVPVPSDHAFALRWAEAVADRLDADVSRLVRRRTGARPQVGLSRKERRVNAARSFERASSPVPQSVLVLDDIVTTGSTIAAVTRLLRDAGALRVDAAAIALTPASPEPGSFRERPRRS